MGMFDYFQPTPPLRCPVCDALLDGWQGKEGPCGLFVWRQGMASPVDQAVDDEIKHRPDELAQVTLLQSRFVFYTSCDRCDRSPVRAIGFVIDGVWARTEIETPENAVIETFETEHDFRVRIARLREWLNGAAPGSGDRWRQ